MKITKIKTKAGTFGSPVSTELGTIVERMQSADIKASADRIKAIQKIEEIGTSYAIGRDAAFTHYCDQSLDLKQVVNTNKCLVHIDAFDNKLLVTSCIDNLLKGAVGQAVQNMNLMFGIDETAGLRLKASVF